MMIILFTALTAGCSSAAPAGSAADAPGPSSAQQRFPDIVGAMASRSGEQFSFSVTVSSPYDTPERYADAFRVRAMDGTVYGINELAHDHAGEQPFTRTLSGVTIPAGVAGVVVEGRDLLNGWGGGTRTVELPQ